MRRRALVLSCVSVASCKACEAPPPPPRADATVAVTIVAATDVRDALPEAAAALHDASTFVDDGGVSACKVTYGPMELPFRGPVAFDVRDGQVRLVANDGGKPRVHLPPTSPPTSFVGMRWPPCEIAGRFAYCQGAGGHVYRTTLGATDTKQVATSRSGTRIAAAPVGRDHSVVAFLQSHRTTEGDMLQAFIVLDDGETTRLSDDGAGATTLRLIPRGETAVAVYLDTRTAMVPVHARTVGAKGSDLVLGADAVVFVGGAPERGVDFAVTSAAGEMFAIVPLPRDTLDFGMAAIPIADPPKMDVAAVWSLYPNGLDPAPIGAASAADDAWIARLVPQERAPGAPRVVELGRLSKTGAFRSLGIIARGKPVTDISIERDPAGGLYVAYGDTTATWLERRVCP